MKKILDLVVSGPEMSGTSTQVRDLISSTETLGMKVRDMRGTELDVLFHSELFSRFNTKHRTLQDFINDKKTTNTARNYFLTTTNHLLSAGGTNTDLKIASCVRNQVSSYVNPDSADVWVFEEPTKRGAGQVNRAIEQHRSQYGSTMDPIASAYCHQAYRVDEFLRFRRPLRDAQKIIIRSRSEESACYQIKDKKSLPNGIEESLYLSLPGHQLAFANPPTHIFIACAPEDWTKDGYRDLREKRNFGRLLDDYELNTDYIILVNKRYATDWLENLYEKGCKKYGAKVPKIVRFNMLGSKEEIKSAMTKELQKILK